MSIEANMKARTEAEELIAMCGQQSERFWESLVKLASAKLPAKPDPCPAMGDQEAIRFEGTLYPYGKHAGELVGRVECSYVIFLTEGDEFTKKLRRYAKSKRFQDRQGRE